MRRQVHVFFVIAAAAQTNFPMASGFDPSTIKSPALQEIHRTLSFRSYGEKQFPAMIRELWNTNGVRTMRSDTMTQLVAKTAWFCHLRWGRL